MVNQDYGYIIHQLELRVIELEKRLAGSQNNTSLLTQDWDNATLMREWGISLRSTKNYRERGLEYYKRGGRVYYTQEARNKFLERGGRN